jgi:hypothetical protein
MLGRAALHLLQLWAQELALVLALAAARRQQWLDLQALAVLTEQVVKAEGEHRLQS